MASSVLEQVLEESSGELAASVCRVSVWVMRELWGGTVGMLHNIMNLVAATESHA